MVGEPLLIGDGFDFEIFDAGACELGPTGLLGVEGLDGALDAAWERVQFAEDLVQERDGLGEDVFDFADHGAVVEKFHLEKAHLHVDQLVGEEVLGWGDGFELLHDVGEDFEG